MLEDLRPQTARIPSSYSIALPRLNSYLYNLYIHTERLVKRTAAFTNDPIPSSGIDIINSLITRADIPYLLKFDSDIIRFTKVNSEYRSALYSDFIRQYPIHDKSFIASSKGGSVEYLLITDDFDIIDSLPMGSNSISDWLDVRPLRMLSNDSPELQLDIVTSRLRYRTIAPTEVVFSLNIPKLLMVYTKYRLLYPELFIENTNNYPFIYRACLLPLLYDNITTWMLNLINDIITLKGLDSSARFNSSSLILGEKSNFALGGRQSAILEVEDLLTKCADGKVKPDEIMIAMNLGMSDNLLSEVNWLTNSHYIGNRGNQFRWVEFIREFPILSIMVKLYKLQPDSNRSKEFFKLFEIIARRYYNTRFWQAVGNPYISAGIKSKFEELFELI